MASESTRALLEKLESHGDYPSRQFRFLADEIDLLREETLEELRGQDEMLRQQDRLITSMLLDKRPATNAGESGTVKSTTPTCESTGLDAAMIDAGFGVLVDRAVDAMTDNAVRSLVLEIYRAMEGAK